MDLKKLAEIVDSNGYIFWNEGPTFYSSPKIKVESRVKSLVDEVFQNYGGVFEERDDPSKNMKTGKRYAVWWSGKKALEMISELKPYIKRMRNVRGIQHIEMILGEEL